jgi:hypothetical protein
VIGLSVVATEGHSKAAEMYSGFLLQRGGLYQWVTAGHVLRDLDQLRHRTDTTIRMARWCDNRTSAQDESIPTDLRSMAMVYPQKLDVGVVWFNDHEVDLIRANTSVAPLTAKSWRYNNQAQPDGIYVVGLPKPMRHEQFSRLGRMNSYSFTAGIIALPVVRMIDPTTRDQDHEFWTHHHCLYGQVELPRLEGMPALADIVGTSGGPLLSIERTPGGGLKYRLWAIQSAWLPSLRVVRAEPIQLAVKLIDRTNRKYKKWLATNAIRDSPSSTPRS